MPVYTYAPGARLVIRGEEWLVRRVDTTVTGRSALRVIGLSELVLDREALFLEELEDQIDVVDPKETRLVVDNWPGYRRSLLYLESLLRQTLPTDGDLYVGYRAAMDVAPFQLEPALQAV